MKKFSIIMLVFLFILNSSYCRNRDFVRKEAERTLFSLRPKASLQGEVIGAQSESFLIDQLPMRTKIFVFNELKKNLTGNDYYNAIYSAIALSMNTGLYGDLSSSEKVSVFTSLFDRGLKNDTCIFNIPVFQAILKLLRDNKLEQNRIEEISLFVKSVFEEIENDAINWSKYQFCLPFFGQLYDYISSDAQEAMLDTLTSNYGINSQYDNYVLNTLITVSYNPILLKLVCEKPQEYYMQILKKFINNDMKRYFAYMAIAGSPEFCNNLDASEEMDMVDFIVNDDVYGFRGKASIGYYIAYSAYMIYKIHSYLDENSYKQMCLEEIVFSEEGMLDLNSKALLYRLFGVMNIRLPEKQYIGIENAAGAGLPLSLLDSKKIQKILLKRLKGKNGIKSNDEPKRMVALLAVAVLEINPKNN
ncbi:MAG: hypothetical protein ABIB11_03585, partial [Candidatus Omnitrophota bacterium]